MSWRFKSPKLNIPQRADTEFSKLEMSKHSPSSFKLLNILVAKWMLISPLKCMGYLSSLVLNVCICKMNGLIQLLS